MSLQPPAPDHSPRWITIAYLFSVGLLFTFGESAGAMFLLLLLGLAFLATWWWEKRNNLR